MKKLTAILLTAIMLLSLVACGEKTENPSESGTYSTAVESSQLTGDDAIIANDLKFAMKLWSTGSWVNESNADIKFVFYEDGKGKMANPLEKDIKWTVDSVAKTITITEIYLDNEMTSVTYNLEVGDGYFNLTDLEKNTTAKYIAADK